MREVDSPSGEDGGRDNWPSVSLLGMYIGNRRGRRPRRPVIATMFLRYPRAVVGASHYIRIQQLLDKFMFAG